MHLNTCINCHRAIRTVLDAKSCTACKKHIHIACDPTAGSSDNLFTCLSCREKSLVDGEANDAVMPCVAIEEEEDEDEIEYGIGVRASPIPQRRHVTRSLRASTLTDTGSGGVGKVFACSSAGSARDSSPSGGHMTASSSGVLLDEDPFMGSAPTQIQIHRHTSDSNTTDFFTISSPTPTSEKSGGGGDSLRGDSPTLHNNNNGSEGQASDTDEYKPPSMKRSEAQLSGKGARGGRNGKKKPANISRQSTSMRTRSGGAPPTTSYAHIGSYVDVDVERASSGGGERVRRARGSGNKGKGGGNGRGRRGGGRVSQYIFSSSSNNSSSSMSHRETEHENTVESTVTTTTDGGIGNCGGRNGAKKSETPTDENDYIRTAVVTNAADNFMNSISLCLICGSVGKDVEGTMVTCASCAQSYHTFCVGVHDKLNFAVLKRGWRCLDCTVCEGCGGGKDESNLLLCDECDVSFHIYCLDPPLERIPHGSWRCKWCAMCCRCNKKVQSSLDLQRFEGLCETCYSLRKCLKCSKLYEAGELLIKCQRCIRWFHAKCEHLLTEDAAENAAENAYRCSFCRPQLSTSYHDVLNNSANMDNVMIDKSSAYYIQNNRRANSVANGSFQDSLANVIRNQSCDNDEVENDETDICASVAFGAGGMSIFGGGRTRGGGMGGGRGAGRRPLRLGIGGFVSRMPRHRLAMIADEQQQSQDGAGGNPNVDEEGKPKNRRTRKSRKPQLENAYPAEIQVEFFGSAPVDSRSLAEQMVDEPVLGEFKKPSLDLAFVKIGSELSEQSADALRNEQEQDMLGDILTGMDLELDLDLNEIMNGAADNDDDIEENGLDEPLTDGYSATESNGIITGMCSPSTSGMALGDSHFDMEIGDSQNMSAPSNQRINASSLQHQLQMEQDDQRKRQQQLQSRLSMGNMAVGACGAAMSGTVQRSNSQHSEIGAMERVSQGNQATERWEEDEPLGDKATKAAVLYANLCHPHLKAKYPAWSERVKQITREWRALDADKRQSYVDMARKNRANSGVTTRRRSRRPNNVAPTVVGAQSVAAGAAPSTHCNSGGMAAVAPLAGAVNLQHAAAAPAAAGVTDLATQPVGSNTDLVSAHVTAIKQVLLQQQQQKNFVEPGMANADEKFKAPSIMKESVETQMTNGMYSRMEGANINSNNGNFNVSPGVFENSMGDAQNTTAPTVQSVVTSMLKQQQVFNHQLTQQQQNQLQMSQQQNQFLMAQQQQQRQTSLDPALVERHNCLKRRVIELEKEQQMHDVELVRLRKMKKGLTARHRQLQRNQQRIAESENAPDFDLNDPFQQQIQQNQSDKLNAEALDLQNNADETKRAIQTRVKLADRCKIEFKEHTAILHEFETRHNLPGNNLTAAMHLNESVNVVVNGSSALAGLSQATNIAMHPQIHYQQQNALAGRSMPTCNISSTSSFVVRQQQQQNMPQPQMNIIQQMSSQFSSNSNQPSVAGSQPSQQFSVPPSQSSGGRFVQHGQQQHQMIQQNAMSSSQRFQAQVPAAELAMNSVKQQQLEHQQGSKSPLVNASAKTSMPMMTAAGLLMPQKSGRGRKRKKIQLEDFRSPTLGNIPYNSLQSDLERDVYDVLDGLLNCVVLNTDKRGDATSIKRILYAQSTFQADGSSTSFSGNLPSLDEPPRMKKKRQQFKKQITNDPNEYELMLGRVQAQLDAAQFPKRSLTQYYEFDTNILCYQDMTNLPDRPGKPFIDGCQLGEFALSFMPDYYESIEEGHGVDENLLYPKSMAEICAGVNMSSLISYDDEDLNGGGRTSIDNKFDKNDEQFLFCEPDLLHISLKNLGERARIQKSCLLLGPCHVERQPPLEPHRSFFYKEENNPRENEFKVSLTMDADSIANATELMENLKKILNAKEPFNLEIETPPQSPIAITESIEMSVSEKEMRQEIKLEMDDDVVSSAETKNSTLSARMKVEETVEGAKRCRNCEEFISIAQTTTPIEETMSRLGLTPPEDKDKKVAFCSMKCYYKFMVTCKVPLSVELLDRAEKYVDENTIEKLRQISADSFAKKLQQVQQTSDQRIDIKTSFLSQAAAALCSPISTSNERGGTERPLPNFSGSEVFSENLLESMRQPREQIIRACDLPTIVQSMEAQNKALNAKGEYKWRGHSWMICDLSLLQSFHRPHDEKCASIHLQIHEKNRVSRADDTRFCALCGEHGDGDQDSTGRLLNVDANEWVHVNCALWSSEVHETEGGALLNVEAAIRRAKQVNCLVCGKIGASLKCYKLDCPNHNAGFHLTCAKQNDGKFIRDKTFYCPQHEVRQEMRVHRFDALRRIYVQREENQLLAKIFNHSYPTEMMMRVGSLIFQKIGQLLPEQLKAFHNENHIFPIGYRITRIFWSPTNPQDRTRYECSIEDRKNTPEFCVKFESCREFRDATPSGAWGRILLSVLQAREKAGNMLKFFPNQTNGETLFGFLEPAITKMTESLPGVDQLYTYTFKHGGTPLMDLPLAVNPSGCARCEPCFRTLIKHRYRPLVSISPKKQPLSQSNSFNAEVIPREARSTRSASTRFQSMPSRIDQDMLKAYKASGISEEMLNAPYLRFDTNSQSSNHQVFSQYRRMQKEWPNNVYLARSKIQGLGLYAKRDIDMNAMIIEYKGEVIRSEVGETREKRYMSQNRGVYMFRIDDELLIDATLAGGLARYINHSCDPNCSTKILQYNDDKKIIITANRPVKAGEELTYDYQFELEDTTDKLPCLCGAPNCNKWMN